MKNQGPRIKGGGQRQWAMPSSFMQNKNYFLFHICFFFRKISHFMLYLVYKRIRNAFFRFLERLKWKFIPLTPTLVVPVRSCKNHLDTQIHIVHMMFSKLYLNYLILDFWRCHFPFFIFNPWFKLGITFWPQKV